MLKYKIKPCPLWHGLCLLRAGLAELAGAFRLRGEGDILFGEEHI